MNGPSLTAIVAVVLLLGSAALLASIETVLQRLPLVRALRLAEEERRGAPRLLWLLEHRASSLNVVLICTVTARVVVVALLVVLLDSALAADLGVLAAVLLAIGLSLLVGEIAPRTLTLRHLERAGLRLAPPAVVLVRALTPVAGLVVRAGRAVVPSRGPVSGPYAGAEEVHDDAHPDDSDDEIDAGERAMIRSIFELGDTVVREIMAPRPDMVTIGEHATRQELLDVIVQHGFSRVPVQGERPDGVVGVVYAKDLLRHLATTPEGRWQELIREPMYVPESKRVDDLLRELQEQAVHLALVVDEHGDLAGLVTIEDILEEIVGEIVDEHDQEDPLIERIDDDHVRVDARLSVDALNDLLDADLPAEGWDSVGGLVFATLGRVPVTGERVEIEGLTLTAERVQGRRISKISVVRQPAPANSGAGGERPVRT